MKEANVQQKSNTVKPRARVWEIDFIRGVCLLLMFMDHAFYDLWFLDSWFSNFRAINNPIINALNQFAGVYWSHPIRVGVRLFVVATFFLLSGISSSFSKNQFIRLLKLVVAAEILAQVTQIADALFGLGVSIYFGVLHCMALSLLIFIGLKYLAGDFKRIKPRSQLPLAKVEKADFSKWVYLGVGIGILVLSTSFDWLQLPKVPFLKQYYLDILLGFKEAGADCYGIFPYTGFFLIGCFVGKTLYQNRQSIFPKGDCLLTKPVAFVGKNTLIFYLLHQPVILGIIVLIMLCLGYSVAI